MLFIFLLSALQRVLEDGVNLFSLLNSAFRPRIFQHFLLAIRDSPSDM
jgi:hypothetical protein